MRRSAAYESTAMEFCRNIAAPAAEARAAYLQEAIATLEKELTKRVELLEARIAEHKQWLARRQQLADQVSGALVQMFARMRPDAAAQQVAAMDEMTAAALLMKLEPRTASALLGEVAPAKAARLSGIIASVAELKLPAGGERKSDGARTGGTAEKAK